MREAASQEVVLITGAAGNLGGMLARHLLPRGLALRLMWHRRPLAPDLVGCATAVQADLRDPATLAAALSGVSTVVHFGGVLFAPRPERFLPETNTRWFDNLVTAALEARWLAARRLLAAWRDPTWIQLISTPDFLQATEAAIVSPTVRGEYHLGDEQPVTLQNFLDSACEQWGCPRPHRLPVWTITTAASLCELAAIVAGTPSPLTRDFIRIGRVSYWGDTRRMREELLPTLAYPTLESGRKTL
jgi:uncharacterized protein YbjT (DUF2867 family)